MKYFISFISILFLSVNLYADEVCPFDDHMFNFKGGQAVPNYSPDQMDCLKRFFKRGAEKEMREEFADSKANMIEGCINYYGLRHAFYDDQMGMLREVAEDERFHFGSYRKEPTWFIGPFDNADQGSGYRGLFYHFQYSHNYSIEESIEQVCRAENMIRIIQDLSWKVKFCFDDQVKRRNTLQLHDITCNDPRWKNHYQGKLWIPFKGSSYDFRMDYNACYGKLNLKYENKWNSNETCKPKNKELRMPLFFHHEIPIPYKK